MIKIKIDIDKVDINEVIKINASTEYRIYKLRLKSGDEIIVAGRAVPWKGVRGDKFKRYISPNGKHIWSNLQKAIEVRKKNIALNKTKE